MLWWKLLFMVVSAELTSSNGEVVHVSVHGAVCDGKTLDTAAIQAALMHASDTQQQVVFPAGKTCLTHPLNLSSNLDIFFEEGSTLKAGPSNTWPNISGSGVGFSFYGLPMLSGGLDLPLKNISITGHGTIDGSGKQWWTGNNKTPGRPYILELTADGVVLHNITFLNGAAWHTSLGGSNYLIKNVTIRSPNYQIAPNTDGLDIHAKNVLVTGCDITNGDDSICMKSPAENVLVENSIVRQGNGLVVGTSSGAYFRNITFRNCTAIRTQFGCHIKFKDSQSGSVSGVLFDNIEIYDPTSYAIGIDQNGQSERILARGNAYSPFANVTINNVTFSNINAHRMQPGYCIEGGRFVCNGGQLSCRDITLKNVNLSACKPLGCKFENTFGTGTNVSPISCVPPAK
eukprot:m.343196 g.343196  ORF g.343196 m.343196 type:complete len:401 (-) comp20628_c0_seq4:105-1307(-)